uniref:Allene oxide synthase n=1 Tax=Lemna aequinoctialis TaxID=89585 RepID=F2Q7G6_LEMAE|nr:allene oxide synthase [Lemna aequinoctialis]
MYDSRSDEEVGLVPEKNIPGSYGTPYITPIMDRLEFYSNEYQFFQSRVDRYGSTIVRLNAPPGPFMAKNPRVVALLDGKSFPVLFDTSKVEKKNVFTGTYMPSTALTGGYRVCAYLDPSEPNHTKIKQLLLNILASRKDNVIPEFRSAYGKLFDDMEAEVAKSGKFVFNDHNDGTAFEFLGKLFFGVSPSKTELGPGGVKNANLWLLAQLCPLMTLGLPQLLEELLLHTFPIPPFLVQSQYQALYKYISSAATDALKMAENLGLSREEAIHNLVFATCFNSLGGVKVLFPGILRYIAQAGKILQTLLIADVRSAVLTTGGQLTVEALEKMQVVKSVVYESLRLDPPVKYQYGVVKKDTVIESHDKSYKVKAGEMLFGYQPFATRDKKIFGPDADKFVPLRFTGEQGAKLLQFVLWSNAPETQNPTPLDKQCPGKNLIVLISRLLVAEFFLRYDFFTAEIGVVPLAVKTTITSLTKAKPK